MFFRPALAALVAALFLIHPAAVSQHGVMSPATSRHQLTVDQILINPRVVKRVIPPTFFGINYSAFWEPAEGSATDARALAQTPIKVVRFPGGAPADSYDWQDPYYKKQSQTSPLQLWEWARSFGAKRVVFQTNYQGNMPNPPGQSYAVNSPGNAAAWVEYDKQHRIPADMEVGNEEDWHLIRGKDDPAYGKYIAAFNAQAKAMHGVDSQVRVLGPVATSEWYWRTLDGLGMFLHGAGNRTGTGQVDGVSLHFYAGSGWYDSIGAAQYWLSRVGPWAAIQTLIHANDTRNLSVYVTEWNLGDKDFHNTFTPTFGHALLVADTIGAFALSGVASADYFTIHRSDGWGLFYGTNDARPVDTPTPTYYAMALWSHMGDRMLSLQQSDDPRGGTSAYATKRRNGSLQVLLINKQSTARRIKIALQQRTPAGHHLRVYSLTPSSKNISGLNARYDGRFMPSPQRPLPGAKQLEVVHGKAITYTVPGYSAIVLDLDGTGAASHLRWKSLPPPVPNPGPVIGVTGSVGMRTVRAGGVERVTTVVRSNENIGPVTAVLGVYDSTGTKVFGARQAVTLTSSTPVTVTKNYPVSGTAWSGDYHVNVSIFTRDLSSQIWWKGGVTGFTVIGKPRASVGVTGRVVPATPVLGGTATFVATISVKNAGISNAMVDFEVYDVTGRKVWADQKTGVDVAQNGTANIAVPHVILGDWKKGNYVLKIGVFGATWTPLYVWNGSAATFTL